MKFYRVSYSQFGGNSGGYSWHRSYSDALRTAKLDYDNDPAEYDNHGIKNIKERIETITITPTAKGILDALQRYASHADNG